MGFLLEDFISEKIVSLPPSGIRKFFDLTNERKEIISLSIGEPDFVTPQSFIEAGIKSLREGKTAYSPNAGFIELRTAISKYFEKRFEVSYDPKTEVLITAGSSEGAMLAFLCFHNDSDEILIPDPGYVAYEPLAVMAGFKVVTVPTTLEEGFKVTAAKMEQYVTNKTKFLMLNYPSNPTGITFNKKEIQDIANFAIKHNLIVICDEIYAELTYGFEHISIASLPGMRERTIVMSGTSKAFAMTGWRIGCICAPQGLMEPMLKLHQYMLMCAPTVGQYAALEAYTNGYPEVVKMRDEYDTRRHYIINRFRAMGLDIHEPNGAFYAFPSIQKTGLSSDEFSMGLLDQNVAVVPGNAFGTMGEGFVRCCYASSMENISLACDRMEAYLQTLK